MKTVIEVDAAAELGMIDRRIYGHFVENMARCVYGGFLRNEKPGDPRGPWTLREDLVEMVSALKPPVTRWPGGLYADGYYWRDGIGPLEARPLRRNRYWSRYGPLTRVLDPNTFGTQEFLDLCERLKTEPYLNVNIGTGSAMDAARWVEYVNGSQDTLEGRRRAEYGREKPWGVRTWGIGNEAYGIWSLCHSGSAEYARRFLEFKGAMQEVDDGLQYVAVGAEPYFSKSWNRDVLSLAGGEVDLLSIHIYLPGMERIAGVTATRMLKGAPAMYRAIVASPLEIERRLEQVGKDIAAVMGGDGVKVAFDEWNLWWKPSQLLVPHWTMRDAIFACGVLNVMHRLSGMVTMANVAQLVNVLGVISAGAKGVYRSPLYYAMLLYSTLAGPRRVELKVRGASFDSPALGGIPAISDVPVLDCSATLNENGKVLTIFVINRDPDTDARVALAVKAFDPTGKVEIHCLNGPSADSVNDYGSDKVVSIKKTRIEPSAVLPDAVFPAHSVSALVFKKK